MSDYGYGLTDVVKRPTRSTADLRGADGRGARKRLDTVIARRRPGTVAFVGKAGYRYYLDNWSVPPATARKTRYWPRAHTFFRRLAERSLQTQSTLKSCTGTNN